MIKRLLLVILISAMLLPTGCWNKRELENIGIVMMMAIDKNDEGMFEVFFGVVKPGLLKSSGGGGDAERAAVTFEGRGKTIFEAIRSTLGESPRKLFFGQEMAMVITEKAVQEEEVGDILDIALRDHEFRRNIKLFITPNEGATVLGSEPELENLIAKELSSTIEQSKSSGFFPDININDFTKVLASDVPNPVAPLVSIKPGIQQRRLFEEQSKQPPMVAFVEGAAVFKGEEYVGELDKITTRGWMFATDKINSTILVVQSPGEEPKPISIEIITSKTDIKPELTGELPTINVKVKAEANIAEQLDDTNFTNQEALKTLQKIAEKEIENEIQHTVDKAQLDFETDFFQFGEAVHRKYKDYWKEHKKQWEEIFPDIKIAVDAEVKIRRMGLQTKPLDVK